jgi:hypothetical protein
LGRAAPLAPAEPLPGPGWLAPEDEQGDIVAGWVTAYQGCHHRGAGSVRRLCRHCLAEPGQAVVDWLVRALMARSPPPARQPDLDAAATSGVLHACDLAEPGQARDSPPLYGRVVALSCCARLDLF